MVKFSCSNELERVVLLPWTSLRALSLVGICLGALPGSVRSVDLMSILEGLFFGGTCVFDTICIMGTTFELPLLGARGDDVHIILRIITFAASDFRLHLIGRGRTYIGGCAIGVGGLPFRGRGRIRIHRCVAPSTSPDTAIAPASSTLADGRICVESHIFDKKNGINPRGSGPFFMYLQYIVTRWKI